MEYWKNLAEASQGYSPAEKDLHSGPRVILRYEPPPPLPAKALPRKRITLKFHQVDIVVALRTLANAAGVNLMVSSQLQGQVSLNVRNAPWPDVFRSLLKNNGLEYLWVGDILQVMTLAEKKREIEHQELDNQMMQQQRLARQQLPLAVNVVSVRYADAVALQQTLTKILVASNAENGLLPSVEVDEHNNALVIQAPEAELTRLVQLVESLDRPRPQVHLKAYIVEATKETARELGMQWGGIWRSPSLRGNNHGWVGSGGSGSPGVDPLTGGISGGGPAGLGGTPFGLQFSPSNVPNMGSIGMVLGSVTGSRLEVQLNLLEKQGEVNILSSPSLTTLDNKMAYTENGQKIPYVATGGLGDREVRFEDAVLRLEMTPNVIDGQNLKLKIVVKKDEVDTARNVEGNPFIIKKQTATTLVMRNGETVVISGLTREKRSDVSAGVPGRQQVPGGSFLLGHESKNDLWEEVLIFITPTILPPRSIAEAGPEHALDTLKQQEH